VLASLAAPAAGHEQALADTVVDLALALAQQFAAATLAVRRDLVVPAVAGALRELPASTERATLHLNPGDIDAVRAYLAADRHGPVAHLVADPTVTAGGCRIESPQCDVDARVESRWQRLAASLGRDGDWLVAA
jgi:flagellar assembly protein FliH